ncbi:MAG: SRPBCC family protein [Opitutae bacterium]|nr:SRPBCC family protein [Opitutae bacterium]
MTKTYILESISINRPHAQVFDYVSDRRTLPAWTKAFKQVTPTGAQYETPAGPVPIGLEVIAERHSGIVDWLMCFPDGTTEKACSRVIAENAGRTNVQFFFAPPLPPEMLAAGIERFSAVIREELTLLKSILERPA